MSNSISINSIIQHNEMIRKRNIHGLIFVLDISEHYYNDICSLYHGIERDMDKAVYWLERATKQNAVRPMVMLGCCYQDNTYGIANGERVSTSL